MLKLKRVDIHGFKSFYDRTEMKFHGSGVTAIVGPNGCGKSNISDAISWVLGEQSAKSLRGTRMEDVIFAGTRERKPLGMAQVTLSMLDPLGHHQPAGHDGHSSGNGHGNGHGNGQYVPARVPEPVLAGDHFEETMESLISRMGDTMGLIRSLKPDSKNEPPGGL